MVMSGADAEDGMLVAERLRSAIAAAPIMAEGKSLAVTVSIGIASAAAGTPCDDLIAAADAALYRAKNNGRNRVEVAPDSGQAIGRRR